MHHDILIQNARIVTMNPGNPISDAVLIRDGRIAALGPAARAARRARVIDAGGLLVLPGFQDGHIHLLNGGTDLVETAQLYAATTVVALQSALVELPHLSAMAVSRFLGRTQYIDFAWLVSDQPRRRLVSKRPSPCPRSEGGGAGGG